MSDNKNLKRKSMMHELTSVLDRYLNEIPLEGLKGSEKKIKLTFELEKNEKDLKKAIKIDLGNFRIIDDETNAFHLMREAAKEQAIIQKVITLLLEKIVLYHRKYKQNNRI